VSVHVHANACSLRNVVACSMASWASIICLCIGRRPRQIPRKPRGTHPFPCALSRSMDWQGPGRAGVSPAGARWGRKRLGFAGRDAGFPGAPWPTPSAGRDNANLPRAVPTDPEAGPGVWSLESRGAANNFFPFVVLLCRLVPCFAVLLLLVCQAVELSLRLAVTIMVFRICDSESERRGGL
jgi:hypothetical protein